MVAGRWEPRGEMNEVGDVVLEGRLLVATPVLEDPRFRRTVVLLLDHGDDGALGVVLNRPSDVPVDDVLGPWGQVVVGTPVLWYGGPVSTDSALALAAPRRGVEPEGFRPVGTSGLGLVDLDEDPETVSASVSAVRVYAGYAGLGLRPARGRGRGGRLVRRRRAAR